MNFVASRPQQKTGGICLWEIDSQDLSNGSRFKAYLVEHDLSEYFEAEVVRDGQELATQFSLTAKAITQWTPECDTLQLAARMGLATVQRHALETEILVAMLASPVRFQFPSFDELDSSVRMRCNIVEAARKTWLTFAAYQAERPTEYWHYDDERGFLIRPGKCLIEALRAATQPGETGTAYSFSCYRATEYVIALAIAEEALHCNPKLFAQLQHRAETVAIKSSSFHEVFMREYGSREHPLPENFYVPGDRVWFRNPDFHTSDAVGYEGSWVFYLGGGLFTDFWKRNRTFTLRSKLLEIFHWRFAATRNADGEVTIDESKVLAGVKATLECPEECDAIVSRMFRLQDPRGVYADGGCIDATREYPRWVRPETCDIVLPTLQPSQSNVQ